MASLYRTRAYVLSYREISERDRLYVIFTEDYGKKTVLAKGIKREGAKLRYRLDLYSFVEVECVPGRSFDRLVAVRDIAGLKSMLGESKDSLLVYSLALIIFDILETIGQESDPDPELFREIDSLVSTLANTSREELDYVFIFMVFRLLSLCGVGLELTQCVRTGSIRSSRFVLHVREGGLISGHAVSGREGDMDFGLFEIQMLRGFQRGYFREIMDMFQPDPQGAETLIQISLRYLEYQGVRLTSLPFWRHIRYNMS